MHIYIYLFSILIYPAAIVIPVVDVNCLKVNS